MISQEVRDPWRMPLDPGPAVLWADVAMTIGGPMLVGAWKPLVAIDLVKPHSSGYRVAFHILDGRQWMVEPAATLWNYGWWDWA